MDGTADGKYSECSCGIEAERMFDPFPNKIDRFCVNVVREIQSRSFQYILPHPPPVIYAEPDKCIEGEDDYFGKYFPGDDDNTGCLLNPVHGRRIELYRDRIAQCAKGLADETLQYMGLLRVHGALELVILVHELQHGLLHTGSPIWLGEGVDEYGHGKSIPTNKELETFLHARLELWKVFSGRLKEQQAQLGTWHILNQCLDAKAVFLGASGFVWGIFIEQKRG